jgi:hypothetical protein
MQIMPTKAQNNRSLRTLAGILLLLASVVPVAAQTLAPSPYLTVLDNSGNIISGACIWTYSAGTTTPTATYTDSALAVPNANPIIADSAGRYVAYLVNGASYKFVVENIPCSAAGHGTTLKTVDNIKAVPTADTTAQRQLAEGRLTLTSGTAVTRADVSAAATIYYTPAIGNRIALYDGSASWNVRTFTEVSLSISSCTASKPYDVWLYDNAGTVTAEMLVWTNTTTRATGLTRQDGIYVKTGDATRRYVGTFFCNSSGGQTDDSDAKRFVWNYYNRALRRLQRVETTGSWTYTTATIRQANGATANKVEAMIGVAEVAVDLNLHVIVSNSTGGNYNAQVGIAEDLTNTFQTRLNVAQGTAAQAYILDVTHKFIPAEGYHFYAWNEFSAVVGTTTWYGTAAGLGAGLNASGLLGVVGG